MQHAAEPYLNLSEPHDAKLANGVPVAVYSRSDSPSGVTSKPAIEGHFKSGQRTSPWTNLFYLAG
jgi:hypothetical protein